jgi:flagellar FliL protein
MSAAAAAPVTAEAVPVNAVGKKKKLIVIGAVALAVLLAGGGGAAFWWTKKRAAAAAEAAAEQGESGDDEKHAKDDELPKADLKHAPTFVPLDPFTVNLADRDAERYAQVGITLELADAKGGDLLKAYMPAIRNNILLTLAGKTAAQLIEHEGKIQLALEIRAAALKPLGYRVELPAAPAAAATSGAADAEHDETDDEAEAKPAAKPAKKKSKPKDDHADDDVPIRAVHFSNFIIQ